MKQIRTEEAVGHVLCHDMTQIIKDQYKDARFRKGHIVTEEDIPVLLSMGKEHLYVWEVTPGMVHEDAAARRLLALCANQGMEPTAVNMMAPIRNGISSPGTPEFSMRPARSLMAGAALMTLARAPPMPVISSADRATSRPRAIQLFRMTSRKFWGSLPVLSLLLLRTEAL